MNRARRGFALAVHAAGVGCPACRVDEEAFHRRIFGCNPNAANPACGTDEDDRPMACVPAYQLGGRNFCAPGLHGARAAWPTAPRPSACRPEPGAGQQTPGARLARCDPSRPAGSCDHEELSCLRTDLLKKDEGVCMTVNTCQEDRDCRDPVRSKCMGTLLRQTYDKAELITDQTYCLQADCRAHRTACSPGETCMSDVLPASSRPPDICVPNCDANGNCPPNYFCYSSVYSKKLPPICIPGLLGLRCSSNLDCLFGECVASDAGFKSCSVRCQSDVDCARFDSVHATLFCNDAGWCAGVRATRGTQCDVDADCLYPGEICARITNLLAPGPVPAALPLAQVPAPTAACPTPAGRRWTPAAPLQTQTPALGLLARLPGPALLRDRATACRGLSCLPLGPPGPQAKVCTSPCGGDGDCAANRFSKEGWCDAGGRHLPARRSSKARPASATPVRIPQLPGTCERQAMWTPGRLLSRALRAPRWGCCWPSRRRRRPRPRPRRWRCSCWGPPSRTPSWPTTSPRW